MELGGGALEKGAREVWGDGKLSHLSCAIQYHLSTWPIKYAKILKIYKTRGSFSQPHHPHFKCSIAACGDSTGQYRIEGLHADLITLLTFSFLFFF